MSNNISHPENALGKGVRKSKRISSKTSKSSKSSNVNTNFSSCDANTNNKSNQNIQDGNEVQEVSNNVSHSKIVQNHMMDDASDDATISEYFASLCATSSIINEAPQKRKSKENTNNTGHGTNNTKTNNTNIGRGYPSRRDKISSTSKSFRAENCDETFVTGNEEEFFQT